MFVMKCVTTHTHDHGAVASNDRPESLFRGPLVTVEKSVKQFFIARIDFE